MPEPSQPLVRLDPDGSPVVLSYDVPEPMSYRGRHVIELDYPSDYFRPAPHLTRERIVQAFGQARDKGEFDPVVFPDNAGLGAMETWPDRLFGVVQEALDRVGVETVVTHLLDGDLLDLSVRAITGGPSWAVDVGFVPAARARTGRLLLVETYRLSSFPTRYGAGRTIKTFSLLPGERTLRQERLQRGQPQRRQGLHPPGGPRRHQHGRQAGGR